MPKQMNDLDVNYQVKTISLPDTLWSEVDGQAGDWQLGRSAAIRRIIQEWKELKAKAATPKNRKSEPAMIAA